MTNDHGIFSINASKGNTLVFSYVGYDSKEVVVGDEALINVQLNPGSEQLNRVVITALGITKQRSDFVGKLNGATVSIFQ